MILLLGDNAQTIQADFLLLFPPARIRVVSLIIFPGEFTLPSVQLSNQGKNTPTAAPVFVVLFFFFLISVVRKSIFNASSILQATSCA